MAAPPEAPRPRPGIGAAVAAAERQARRSLLRNHGGGHAPVSNLELFFDLVFVFAITQISGFLHHHLGLSGLIEGTVVFLAVWWVWMYTTWVTNWLNPDRQPVRILLIVLMLGSLAMAVALPDAFAEGHANKALLFAGCYAGMQLGRSATVSWFFHRDKAPNTRNMVRISCWFAASLPLWIGGAVADGHIRLGMWLIALVIDYSGPFALYRVPGLGQSNTSDWNISGSHMAERCSLFIIIALGEGIVVTGGSFASEPITSVSIAALLAAFLTSVLMWWLYFDMGADRGARMIAGHAQVGRVARNAYTYLHMPIVLGIIVFAVGDALVMEQAGETASHELVLVQTGGALLFLTGLGLFKRFSNTLGNFPMSHLIAVGGFIALGVTAWLTPLSTLSFAHWGGAILLLAAVWEWVSYHGGWAERAVAIGLPVPQAMLDRAEARRARVEARRG